MSGSSFLDTNVIVYLHHAAEVHKRARAKEILSSGEMFVVSTQVLAEAYSTLTRKLRPPLDPADAESALRDLSRLRVVGVDAGLVLAAVALSRRRQLSIWDALIVQCALAAGCTRLLSEDLQDGARFGALRVENPFAQTAREPEPIAPTPAAPRRRAAGTAIEKMVRMWVEQSSGHWRLWDRDMTIPRTARDPRIQIDGVWETRPLRFNTGWGKRFDPAGEGCWLKQFTRVGFSAGLGYHEYLVRYLP